MVLVRNSVHAASLSPAMQKKVVHLRDKKKLPFWQVALKVKDLQQDNPSTQNVLNVYNRFSQPATSTYKKDNLSQVWSQSLETHGGSAEVLGEALVVSAR